MPNVRSKLALVSPFLVHGQAQSTAFGPRSCFHLEPGSIFWEAHFDSGVVFVLTTLTGHPEATADSPRFNGAVMGPV